ncbi:MAG: helix-turn-helix transcriptional regulator [Bryobacteraceae bacterium]
MPLEEAWTRCTERVFAQLDELYAGKHEKLVERARRMVEWSLERPEPGARLTLESVASSLGVSAGHFSRCFSRIMGVSFRQYVTHMRLERACRLLLEPMYNVSQVAEACGYPSVGYFVRFFRKAMGCTPGKYARHPGCIMKVPIRSSR